MGAALAVALGCALLLLALPYSAAQEAPPPQPATGVREIVIGGGRQRFAVPDCVPKRRDDATLAACRTVTDVLRADLQFEGIFQFVPDALLKAVPPLTPEAPRFDDWKAIDAQILVTLTADSSGGNLAVGLRLFFVETGQTMLAKQYSGKADNPRVFAHQAADDILAQVQYRGVARTKIVFTSDRDATKGKATKELYIVDYDGYNPRRVTVNRSLNILPTWSPDGRSLAYVSYRAGIPDLFLAWIYEGRSQNIGDGGARGSGQTFGPAFSPDGKRLAFASSRSGNMEIWVANADGTGARRLTTSSGVDTAPCWSPTGQEIAFTSDRGGTPQIWLMDSEGLNVRRLTEVGNYNDGATWNPSKEHPEIAYTSRIEGRFQVAAVDLATRQVRQVTDAVGSCESPAWAPSGRHLVFACSRGGRWQIVVSDREGRRVRPLDTGGGSNAQPDWGPWPTQ